MLTMLTITADCLTVPTAGVTVAEVKNWVLPFQVGILPEEQFTDEIVMEIKDVLSKESEA